ncbi:MAG: ABC transporter ATP-binding protein [Erysipelotrichaceae bacterium]|nr:ABC transporter ATP-binding protein [Erysipelotrichaceae bacterium]
MTNDKYTPAIIVEDLSVYYGKTLAIDNINLIIKDKEYLGIVGPNGSGKSTLLKALIGLVPSVKGKVSIYGDKIEDARKMIGYVPQFSEVDKSFPITVNEVILSGMLKRSLSLFHHYDESDFKLALELLDRVGLAHLKQRQINELSGGEFQKMLIARALATNPKILLLDEPTASVDATARKNIYELLAELNKKMTIVLVTHDTLAISSQVHSLACMNQSLVYHGSPEFSENTINKLYGCPVELIAHGIPHRVLKEHQEVQKS